VVTTKCVPESVSPVDIKDIIKRHQFGLVAQLVRATDLAPMN